MDKITRIHLARVPYEIGVTAEEELSRYLKQIRKRLDPELADEIITDIEARITEILESRGVKANGVITGADIAAVKDQLGMPEQFGQDDGVTAEQRDVSGNAKRLLRDTQNGYIGGVASGLGAFLNVDPVIVRIAFILLTFLSGFGVLLYLLLWLLVPPAVTSSDKLQMRGEAVTAATLQHYRNAAEHTIENMRLKAAADLLKKVVKVLFSAFISGLILMLLYGISVGTAVLFTDPLHPVFAQYKLNYLALFLVWLLYISLAGLAVSMLIRLWRGGYKQLKRVSIGCIGIFVAAVIGISASAPFISNHYYNEYGNGKLTAAVAVQDSGSPVSRLLIANQSSDLDVTYVVSGNQLRATYQEFPGMNRPDFKISSSNGTVSVNASDIGKDPSCILDWCRNLYKPARLTIYGPAIQKVDVSGGAQLEMDNFDVKDFSASAGGTSSVNISSAYADNMSLAVSDNASIYASTSSAQTANVTVNGVSGYIEAPASSKLNASMPVECSNPLLNLNQLPGSATLNGQNLPVDNFNQDSCVNVNNVVPPSQPDQATNMSVQPQKPFLQNS